MLPTNVSDLGTENYFRTPNPTLPTDLVDLELCGLKYD